MVSHPEHRKEDCHADIDKTSPPAFFDRHCLCRGQAENPPPPKTKVVVREIKYDGQLSGVKARFGVDLDLEVTGQGEAELPLFNGEVAVLTAKLPANLRLAREGNQFRLFVAREGRYKFTLDLVAKIHRQDPWDQVSFTGPEAAIGSVNVQASGAGLELQLFSGTTQDSVNNNGVARVRGFLGPDRMVSVRWQSKAAEVTRKALMTSATTGTSSSWRKTCAASRAAICSKRSRHSFRKTVVVRL
jgi:hypothetical protein